VAYGIFSSQASATCVTNIYNNYIGRIYSNYSNNWQCVRGINLGSTVANTTNLYYNTVNLDGIPAAGSYCIYKSSATSKVNIRNNIFINNCSSESGYEQFAYFFVGVTSTTNYLTTSNNNLLFCGTPGPLNLIFADGAVNALTNTKQTLAEFKTFAAPVKASA